VALEHIDRALSRLQAAGVTSPEADAWHLLSYVTGISRGELHAQAIAGSLELSSDAVVRFDQALARRERREPLWHITGLAPFLNLELSVGPGVFTPRPETELLAEQGRTELELMPPREGEIQVVDLCAGSGAIGLAIAHSSPHARVLAVEISSEAAEYLQSNVARFAPESVEVMIGDVHDALSARPEGSVDLVVSNPPYLVEGVDQLDAETRESDPDIALFADQQGLAVIDRVITVSSALLRDGGVVLIEHGIDHAIDIRDLLTRAGFVRVETMTDLLGRPRFTRAERARR